MKAQEFDISSTHAKKPAILCLLVVGLYLEFRVYLIFSQLNMNRIDNSRYTNLIAMGAHHFRTVFISYVYSRIERAEDD